MVSRVVGREELVVLVGDAMVDLVGVVFLVAVATGVRGLVAVVVVDRLLATLGGRLEARPAVAVREADAVVGVVARAERRRFSTPGALFAVVDAASLRSDDVVEEVGRGDAVAVVRGATRELAAAVLEVARVVRGFGRVDEVAVVLLSLLGTVVLGVLLTRAVAGVFLVSSVVVVPARALPAAVEGAFAAGLFLSIGRSGNGW